MTLLWIGLGTIGSWVLRSYALFSKFADFDEIRLIDIDNVELRNVGIQDYTMFEIGVQKAVVMVKRMIEIGVMQEHNIQSLVMDANTMNDGFFSEDTYIVDCMDNYKSRAYIHNMARKHGAKVIHIGFGFAGDQLVAGISPEIRIFKDAPHDIDKDVCVQPENIWFFQTVAGIFAKIVDDFIKEKHISAYIFEKDLKKCLTNL